MNETSEMPERVHLVGSIGLDNVDEVFQTAGRLLGRRLRRIPDGEPGGRRLWISWQYPLLRGNPFLIDDPAPTRDTVGCPTLCLAQGVGPDDIRFGELGYAREARASYQDFIAARKRGDIARNVRFQVCLPTPLAVIWSWCSDKDMFAIERAYEKAMMREVETICAAIPHKDLSIQWDVCNEMVMWDGRWKLWQPPFGEADVEREILTRMQRLGDAIPADIELGIHLCYGDWKATHFVEPEDAGKMVSLANGIASSVSRPITYLHMPVPINRADDAFFAPLRDLKLAAETELYLGVVHADGAENVGRRVAAARRYVKDFGIATECGMARCRTPDVVESLLRIHAESSREPKRAARKRAATAGVSP
jgi:hypothetical protein